MKNIITPGKDNEHHIRPYNFRVLTKEIINAAKEGIDLNKIQESIPEPTQPPTPPATEAIEPDNKVDEQLFSKLDELSDRVIKLQMQLEKQEADFQQRLDSELQSAKEIAFNQGKDSAAAEFQEQLNKLKSSISTTSNKLNQAASDFDAFLNKSSEELKEAALMIAKEVLNKELSASSAQIALNYAKALIAQLDKEAKAKISVNPNDYEFIKENIQSERISVVADEAIAPGALILNSQMLNTKINIQERFAQAKALISN